MEDIPSKIRQQLGLVCDVKAVSGQLNQVVRRLVDIGYIAMTSPERPNSRMQKYQVTDKGRLLLD
jgi:ATP-dependent DNA helicase RecG